MQLEAIAIIVALITCAIAVLIFYCFVKVWNTCRRISKKNRLNSNQQEDIFNISSRVQSQGQWPTHDAHVSLDHFTIASELNKHNDDPPSYEEAMRLAMAASRDPNNDVVPAASSISSSVPVPKTTTTSSTSTLPPPPPPPTSTTTN